MTVRRDGLVARFGEEVTERILRQEVWIGATDEELRESIGAPDDVDERVMKRKTRHVYKYCETGKNRYALRVTLEEGVVTGWEGKPEAPRERKAAQKAFEEHVEQEIQAERDRKHREAIAAEERLAASRLIEQRIAADAERTAAAMAQSHQRHRRRVIQKWLFLLVSALFLIIVVRWRCLSDRADESRKESSVVPQPIPPAPATPPTPAQTSTTAPGRSSVPQKQALPRRDAGSGASSVARPPVAAPAETRAPDDPY